jgi:acyl CoA:acetate/3-ketoacid CoA transferase beta subunit
MTQHITKEGKPKLVQNCTLPLTGAGVVSRVYSDYAVIDITKEGFKVIDMNENISIDYLQNITDGKVYL